MRRSILITAVAVLLLVAGCGGGHSGSSPSVVSSQPATTPCNAPVPAHMGECVQQRFGLAPGVSTLAHGWDISVYQGTPSFPASLRFVYNQVGDGTSYRDPNFSASCAREKRQGIKCGAYLFVRPGDAAGQAAVIRYVLAQTDLPPALDVEVPGAYGELCLIAHDLHVLIVVAYTAPGLWPGGATCGTRLWAAEWGTAGYAFAGWSSYVAQQTCGTCGVDEDSDHGLLALVHPAPTHAQVLARWHRELDAHYRLRAELHGDIDRHHCRLGKPWYGHATPSSYHTVCGDWLEHGEREVRIINAFHQKGVW
jgi:Glycosyl hydrolases family 25